MPKPNPTNDRMVGLGQGDGGDGGLWGGGFWHQVAVTNHPYVTTVGWECVALFSENKTQQFHFAYWCVYKQHPTGFKHREDRTLESQLGLLTPNPPGHEASTAGTPVTEILSKKKLNNDFIGWSVYFCGNYLELEAVCTVFAVNWCHFSSICQQPTAAESFIWVPVLSVSLEN